MFLLPSQLRQFFKRKWGKGKRGFAFVASVLKLTHPDQQGRVEETERSTEFEIFPADPASRKLWFSLTIREREVAALLCMGYQNSEIAAMLGVGSGTVQTHLQHIFRKFGLRGRQEIRRALKSWAAEDWWKIHHE